MRGITLLLCLLFNFCFCSFFVEKSIEVMGLGTTTNPELVLLNPLIVPEKNIIVQGDASKNESDYISFSLSMGNIAPSGEVPEFDIIDTQNLILKTSQSSSNFEVRLHLFNESTLFCELRYSSSSAAEVDDNFLIFFRYDLSSSDSIFQHTQTSEPIMGWSFERFLQRGSDVRLVSSKNPDFILFFNPYYHSSWDETEYGSYSPKAFLALIMWDSSSSSFKEYEKIDDSDFKSGTKMVITNESVILCNFESSSFRFQVHDLSDLSSYTKKNHSIVVDGGYFIELFVFQSQRNVDVFYIFLFFHESPTILLEYNFKKDEIIRYPDSFLGDVAPVEYANPGGDGERFFLFVDQYPDDHFVIFFDSNQTYELAVVFIYPDLRSNTLTRTIIESPEIYFEYEGKIRPSSSSLKDFLGLYWDHSSAVYDEMNFYDFDAENVIWDQSPFRVPHSEDFLSSPKKKGSFRIFEEGADYQTGTTGTYISIIEFQYSLCPAGFYYSNYSLDVGICKRCESNFHNTPSMNNPIMTCGTTCNDLGRYTNTENFDPDDCTSCPNGTYSINPENCIAASDCVKAPPGTFIDITGCDGVHCFTPCPIGTWTEKSGSYSVDECIECDAEFICPLGSSYQLSGESLDYELNGVEYTESLVDVETVSPYDNFFSSSLFWKLVFGFLIFFFCILILFVLIVFSFVPYDKLKINKNTGKKTILYYLLFPIQFKNLDFYFSDRHDSEDMTFPIKRRTFVGGFFSICVIFLTLAFMSFSLIDFFLDNIYVMKNVQLYVDNLEPGVFRGDFKIGINMRGKFTESYCSNELSSFSFVGGRGTEGLTSKYFDCSLNDAATADSYSICSCVWKCPDCDIWRLLDDTVPHFELYNGGLSMNQIEYTITVPSVDGPFTATGFIEEFNGSINSLDVDVNIFSTEKWTWNRWNYFLSPIGVEDMYTTKKGMMSSIKSAIKTVGELSFFVNVDFSFTLSDFFIKTEENTEQGILNLIAQMFALFGLSVSIMGIFFAFTENYCLRQPPEVKASELLIKKSVMNYRKSFSMSSGQSKRLIGKKEDLSTTQEDEEKEMKDVVLLNTFESDEPMEESNEEEEHDEKNETEKTKVKKSTTKKENDNNTQHKRNLEKIAGLLKSEKDVDEFIDVLRNVKLHLRENQEKQY